MTPRATPATANPIRTETLRYAGEPSLAEMLEDPVVRAMMAVDGVRPDDIETLLSAARERLQ